MQYSPITGNTKRPKQQQVHQHENIRYYKITDFIYKFSVCGGKSGWAYIVRTWQNLQILKNADKVEKIII